MKKDLFKIILWIFIGIIGASSLAGIALSRGETISSTWFVTACICIQLIAYRFYSAFIATKVFVLHNNTQTPARRLKDGKDFIPTNKWIVFGHHFAAIAGPGPLIGPTLAAQFGYLPGVLWILIGSVLAGAVQDMLILAISVKRDGKSLGQMIREEIGNIAGCAALLGTFAIIIILISVLGLIVVKALNHSPWGSFTVFMTVPIAMIVGIYLYYKPSKTLNATIFGLVMFYFAIKGGQLVYNDHFFAKFFNFDGKFLAWSIMIYGFAAASLPVWLLLTPRDYLSSFLKIGTILLLTIAILVYQPDIQMPALTQFTNGSGPIFSGKIFPFLFITIACGAISGFHSLVASGTTPKMISNEKDVRFIGYGSMLLESFVALIALIAACSLEPGVFFAINSPASATGSDLHTAINTINCWGFAVSEQEMIDLANRAEEETLLARTGGAPSLAIGMAKIFSSTFGKSMFSMWYHFAIMFEAIFILTTLDAGTRVARFMLQDLIGAKKFQNKHPNLSTMFASFLVVAAWGYFLYIGVIDPQGGVNILWPLFGMSNQMLAGIALTLATTVILKGSKRKRYFLVTAIPLAFVLITTTATVLEKLFSSNIKIGFFAMANFMKKQLENGAIVDPEKIELTKQMIFNQRLLGFIAALFAVILWIVVIEAVRKSWPRFKKHS